MPTILQMFGRVPYSGRAPGTRRSPGNAVFPGDRPVVRQTWPAFSSAAQQVPVIRRATTYGSTLAFGRRSSM